jgi:peptidoglycan/LPS O-acetylase OafA/YrhL
MRRLDFVDSLRGLAALYVVVYHMMVVPDPHLKVPHWAQLVVFYGATAVALFFVVSAFSLCHTMMAHSGQPGAVRDFYIRRFFRIAPLFYAMLVFTAVRDVLYFGAWHSVWERTKSVLFVFNFFPGSEVGIVWASWTIGVEMVFYLVFPLLFARFRSLPSLLALAFAALLGTVVFHEFVLYLPVPAAIQNSFYQISFFHTFPVFIFGMLCWLIFDRFITDHKHSPSIGAALILGSLWAYHALMNGALNVGFPDPYYWPAIIYSALFLGLAILPTPVFANRVSRFAGRISYSIYLLHPPIIVFLIPVYRRIYLIGLPVSASFLLCFGVTLGIVLPASVVTYRWIEAPGMKLGKRLLAPKPVDPVAVATGLLPGQPVKTLVQRYQGQRCWSESTPPPARSHPASRPARHIPPPP